MQNSLKDLLWEYISENNPDLMYDLQESYSVTRYLEEKVAAVLPLAGRLLSEKVPAYVIRELCLNQMSADLKPSRYNKIIGILAEEFEVEHVRLTESGLLMYEGVNLVIHCKETFDEQKFSVENEDDHTTYYMLVDRIAEYFEEQGKQ